MDSNYEYFSNDGLSDECLSGDSSQNEISEDEMFHVSSTISRHLMESDTENETDTDENENSNDIGNNEWSHIMQTPANVIPFVKSKAAIKVEGDQVQDFYFSFVTEEILQTIVDETNRYAVQIMENRSSTRLDKWQPTNKNEMKRFFGLLLWMGLVKLPKIDLYWSRDSMYCQSFPKTVMSRNRFELLLRFLHFNNNQAANTNDRLYKISKFVDALNQNFSKYYELDEGVSIDEFLVPFRGRIIFRPFLKQTHHKYGVKVLKLCSGLGYTYKFQIYSGKKSNTPSLVLTNIIMHMCNDILNKGHTVYTNNWYTNINLAEKLIACNTHLVGIIRKNCKEIPEKVTLKKLKQGELIAMQNKKGITILKWKDKQDIVMLSTKHSTETATIHKNNCTREKPMAVLDYNIGKCPVDFFDQMIPYSTPLRKTLKWYIKLAIELLLNTAVTNALLLYKLTTKKRIKVCDFRMALAMHLTQCHDVEVPAPSNISIRKRLRHEMQKKEGLAHLVRKFCKVCYQKNVASFGTNVAKNQTKKVTTYCGDCVGQPHLCLKCFNIIHR